MNDPGSSTVPHLLTTLRNKYPYTYMRLTLERNENSKPLFDYLDKKQQANVRLEKPPSRSAEDKLRDLIAQDHAMFGGGQKAKFTPEEKVQAEKYERMLQLERSKQVAYPRKEWRSEGGTVVTDGNFVC